MINKELLDYIKIESEKGIEREQITQVLLGVGWRLSEVNEIFESYLNTQKTPEESVIEKVVNEPANLVGQPLLSFGDLFSNAARIYTHRFWTFLGINLIPEVWKLVIGILVTIFVFSIIGSIFMALSGAEVGSGFDSFLNLGPMIFGLVFFIILSTLVMNNWASGALIYAIKGTPSGIGFTESYRKGWHKVISLTFVGILSFLVIYFGFLLFLIPGIFFLTWFSFASYIVVAEDLGALSALAKSREYVRGYGLKIFWRLFLIGLIYGFLIGAISILLNRLLGEGTWLAEILTKVIATIFSPFLAIFGYLLYDQLKDRKPNLETPKASGLRIIIILISILAIFTTAIGIYFFGSMIKESAQERFNLKEIQVHGNPDLKQKDLFIQNGDQKVPLTPEDIGGQKQT